MIHRNQLRNKNIIPYHQSNNYQERAHAVPLHLKTLLQGRLQVHC